MSGLDDNKGAGHEEVLFVRLLERLLAGERPDERWSREIKPVVRPAVAPAPEFGRAYGRRLLHDSKLGEVLLMGWSERQACLPHDHGLAFGWVYVVQGTASFRAWTVDQEPEDERGWQRYEQGAWVHVPQNQIHQMFGEGAAVTLHLYTPSIAEMRVYDPEQKKAWLVSGDCGAWVPDEATVLRQLQWDA